MRRSQGLPIIVENSPSIQQRFPSYLGIFRQESATDTIGKPYAVDRGESDLCHATPNLLDAHFWEVWRCTSPHACPAPDMDKWF